ncbi:RING-type domain-containing protein [Mycena sanguinolenta]|uniref:RING-type domain-containing protein n=1 Tax=Mycena sanguinolenta TaxID=230812 RepID=A0A8H7D296_9AGAR|nr:RING-type domain-containing protein [Mycena sanguinolenta]
MAPKPAGMRLALPDYSPEVEYTLNLGAETSRSATPLPSDSESSPNISAKSPPSPSPVRTRSWRPEGVEREQKARSTAYDAAGNLKIAVRGRKAAANDCGICEEVAVEPVKTQCCGALFCRQHIDEWIYAPSADGRCPRMQSPLRPPALPPYVTCLALAIPPPPHRTLPRPPGRPPENVKTSSAAPPRSSAEPARARRRRLRAFLRLRPRLVRPSITQTRRCRRLRGNKENTPARVWTRSFAFLAGSWRCSCSWVL